jgi:outer membrane protein assembly factor BamB
MSTDDRLPLLLADILQAQAPTSSPNEVRSNVATSTGRMRPRPRWLAFIKEPSMRIHARVAVGSPTVRVAAFAAATMTLLLVVAGAVVGAATLMPSNPATVAPSPGPSPALAGSADWTMYRGNAARTGVATSAGPRNNPVQLWRLQESDKIGSEPAVVGGLVYVGCDDGQLFALDTATGDQRWQIQTMASVGTAPAVDGGLVYIGSSQNSLTGNLFAIDALTGPTGGIPATVRWISPDSSSGISPAVVDGVVYTGAAADNYLAALDAKTGVEKARFQLGAAVSRSPAVADRMLFVGSADAAVHAFDTATGQQRWRFQTDGGTPGTPVVSGGVVYEAVFGGTADALYAVDEQTGKALWRFRSPTGQSVWVPAVSGDRVYAASSDGALYAIDAVTGTEVWHFTSPGSQSISAVTLADGVIYTAQNQTLYAIDPETGQALWDFALDGNVAAGPSISNGVVYVGTDAGGIYAIGSGQAGAGQPTASASPASINSPSAAAATP